MRLGMGAAAAVAAFVIVLLLSHGGFGHGWWIAVNLALLPLAFGFVYFLLRD